MSYFKTEVIETVIVLDHRSKFNSPKVLTEIQSAAFAQSFLEPKTILC